eukprot:TRINITY_DN4815_c1_g1_i1.p2 TRINITY_DN4815_c1_g1~~TRINITY_DN4815_c1_g1_i1.p2  ORF type:complete len:225 (+),score=34.91 TRINITY_DN4815_c1_g1_i1:2-676(+)
MHIQALLLLGWMGALHWTGLGLPSAQIIVMKMETDIVQAVQSEDDAPEEQSLAQVKSLALEQLEQEARSQNKQLKRKKKRKQKETDISPQLHPNPKSHSQSQQQDIDEDEKNYEEDEQDEEEEELPQNIQRSLQLQKQKKMEQQQNFDGEVNRCRLLISKRARVDEIDKGVVKVRVLRTSQVVKPAEKANNFLKESLLKKGRRSMCMLNTREDSNSYGVAAIFK